MEKLYHTKIPKRDLKERKVSIQNPIEQGSRTFNITDGDKKSLDYLDCASNITKATLAANGVIKLCPKCNGLHGNHYGAIAAPLYAQSKSENTIKEEDNEDFKNEWDNIFLRPPEE